MQGTPGNFVDDPTGLTNQEFRFAYWWAAHRKQLRVWWVLVFALVTLGIVLTDLYLFTIYSVRTVSTHRLIGEMGQGIVKIPDETASAVAESLEFEAVQTVSGVDGYSDIVMRVHNPNERWAVERLDVRFVDAGVATRSVTAQLLPEETTYVFVPNVKLSTTSATPSAEILDTVWKRATREELRSPEFEIKNVTIADTVTTDDQLLTRVESEVRNLSVQDFPAAVFTVVLLDARGGVVGIQDQTISDFHSLEVASFTVTFNRRVSGARTAEIYPKTLLP